MATTREDVLWAADINNKNAIQALRQIELRLSAIEANRAFDVLEKKLAGVSHASGQAAAGIKNAEHQTKQLSAGGVAAGTVLANAFTGAVVALERMGERGLQIVKDLSNESANMAQQYQIASITFENMFGSQEASVATIEHLRQLAAQLGFEFQDLMTLGRGLLPDVTSMAQFDKLIGQIRLLGELEPAQGVEGARRSVEEAISGNVRTLQMRFNIPKNYIDDIKKLQKEMGPLPGLIEGLNLMFERQGLSVDMFTNSIGAMRGKVKAAFQELQIIGGTPILAAQRKDAERMMQLFEERGPELKLAAEAIGLVIAQIIDLASQAKVAFLEGIDVEQVVEIAAKFSELVDTAGTFVQILTGAEFSGNLLDGLEWVIDTLQAALMTAAQISALLGGEKARQAAISEAQMQRVKGTPEEGLASMGVLKATPEDIAAGEKAYRESMLQSIEVFKEHDRRLAANRVAWRDLGKATKEASQEGMDATEAVLASHAMINKAAQELADSITAMQIDVTRHLLDLATKAAREQQDLDLKEARYREDLAIRQGRQIEDMMRGAEDERTKSLEKATKARQNLEDKAGRDRIKMEVDHRKKVVDIERKFRQTLEDIQRDFMRSAREAAIANDAIAFLQAKRGADDQAEDARVRRGREMDDEALSFRERSDEFEASLDEQRQTLQDNLDEQMRSVDENIQKQKDAMDLARRREEDDHRLSLDRQKQDRDIALQRSEEDYATSLDRRIADLEASTGQMTDITAQSLLDQAAEYVHIYGEDGPIAQTMQDFFARRIAEMQGLREEVHATMATVGGAYGAASPATAQGISYATAGSMASVGGFYGNPRARFGQGGQVSQLLGIPSPMNAMWRSMNPVINQRSDTVNLNMEGVEPYLQRVVTRSMTEILRNMYAGR